jgi:hypothetical protein
MNDPLPITIRTFGLCQECGAVVHDEAKHFEWHVDQLPDDLPEQVEDPWEEAVEDTGIPGDRRGWEKHLARAIRSASSAMEGDGDADYYRNCLAVAAANVRAMAPEGTEWEEPWSVHGGDASRDGVPRSALRAVLRRLANADGRRPDGRELPDLKRAESYLHGLWLAAQEAK